MLGIRNAATIAEIDLWQQNINNKNNYNNCQILQIKGKRQQTDEFTSTLQNSCSTKS